MTLKIYDESYALGLITLHEILSWHDTKVALELLESDDGGSKGKQASKQAAEFGWWSCLQLYQFALWRPSISPNLASPAV